MKTRNIVLITAGCCVIAGAVIAGAAAIKLQNTHKYEDKEVTREIMDRVTKIDVQSKYGDIRILPSENDKLTVDYMECDQNSYQIEVKNETLIISPAKNASRWFDRVLNIDVHRNECYLVDIRIPGNIVPDIDVENDCGDVEISGGKFKNVKCGVDLGGLKIDGITADNINIESDCGDVELNNVTADISAECDMGDLRLNRAKGKNIMLYNDYGNIEGTILGNEKDYTINTEAKAGNNNLQNRTGGSSRLDIAVDMGDIDIKFID